LPEIERWAGLRPGTPDDLPYLGALGPGLWVATGHFRDGILLTPITAQLMADLVTARPLSATGCLDLSAFSPTRQPVSSSGPG
ncbi:MAG: FAD-dependent oxidoreductase, partial [Terriglobales bacterium]